MGRSDVNVVCFKMPFETKHFNKNQKVWVQITTGNMAAKVIGRFRGKHGYVCAWVSWDRKNRESPDFKKIKVDRRFAENRGLLTYDED